MNQKRRKKKRNFCIFLYNVTNDVDRTKTPGHHCDVSADTFLVVGVGSVDDGLCPEGDVVGVALEGLAVGGAVEQARQAPHGRRSCSAVRCEPH